jgi:hypothetical protein
VSWAWGYVTRGEACGASKEFESRDAAEAWLSESWTKLVESRIEEVELAEDGEVAYRMKLSEE